MIEIRPFDFAKDWTHYCALHHQARGRAVDQAFIKWKYFDNPAGQPIAYGAWDDDRLPASGIDKTSASSVEPLSLTSPGKLVGFAALIPQRFCVQGEEHIIGMGEDMAAPNYDREEIVVRLTEKLLEDMSAKGWLWSYHVATKKDGEIYVNRLGHTKVAEIPCWVKIRKWRLVKKWLGLKGRPRETAGFRMAYHSYRVRMVREFDARFDQLWERCRNEHPISVVKDVKYLKWRYLDRPDGQHQVLTVEDQGKLKGYAVLWCGDLLELFCEVDTDAYKTLAKAIDKVWKSTSQGISRAYILGNILVEKALAEKGWRERSGAYTGLGGHEAFSLHVYSVPNLITAPLCLKGANWRLSMADTTLVQ